MFRFFRRKKSKEENKVNQEPESTLVPEQVEESESEVAGVEPEEATLTPSAPAAPSEPETVPAPASSPSPVTESGSVEPKVTDEAIESEPMVEARVEEVGAVSETGPVATPEAAEEAKLVVPATEAVQEQPVQEAEPAPKASWMQRLRQGLSRTGSNIGSLFVGVKVDEELFEELETALLMADAGIEATESLLTKLRAKVKQQRIEEGEQVKEALKELLTEHLKPLEKSFMLPLDGTSVVMIAGVNGAGKTTSIGKLAHHFQASGASVLLAAGDTFRAAAREQLVEWGKRNNVAVISQDGGDPAAVAFDAVNAGKARQANVVMIDTAGRLPTQLHLMEELKKIKRVINKADNEAPHEVLLVVDGNTGQNVITQIKTFDAALGLTGLVVTKLDGTAKGGTLAAVAAGSQGVRPIPVYWIGVGESLHDLQPFSAAEFASALLG
ncbi:Cell division protein FtsY homolog [Oligella ureolytica]|uniref:signal recognition particle-docking protein FtsY n=1 Tax=Oligella ureolytica TaxID=90244 RepID=UPI000DFC48D8|nr:signal recognition particle-docking protein FtsY [Oligella ureolytica]SUA57950.1 Cell division protein FtsY homolog [Oligella ureolytica]